MTRDDISCINVSKSEHILTVRFALKNHFITPSFKFSVPRSLLSSIGPRQANLVLIDYASSKGSGEPTHPGSLARTSATRSYN